MTEAVKDAAKVYADRHGTSVSALVEAYLGQLATEGQWPRRRATLEEVAKLKGKILTGAGNTLLPGGSPAGAGAYYENGTLLVDEDDPLSPASINLRAILRGKGLEIETEWLVPGEAIRKANTVSARINDMQAMQREFLDIVGEAASAGATDVRISVSGHVAEVAYKVDGMFMTAHELEGVHGGEMCVAAFNMADASDATYRQLEYQGARISDQRTPLPLAVRSVSLQFCPMNSGGRLLRAKLNPAVAAGGGTDLHSLGLPLGHAEALATVARRKSGLIILSGKTGNGVTTTYRAAMAAAGAAFPGATVISLEDPPGIPLEGVIQLPILHYATVDEGNERKRQAITGAVRAGADVLGVGEIRDKACAAAALAAAQAGIQVWAVTRANDGVSALAKFREFSGPMTGKGIPVTVMWQHLLPVPCPSCSLTAGSAEARETFPRLHCKGVDADGKECADLPPGARLVRPGGCGTCRGSGIDGRIPVSEVMEPTAQGLRRLEQGELTLENARANWRDTVPVPAWGLAVELVEAGRADLADMMATFSWKL